MAKFNDGTVANPFKLQLYQSGYAKQIAQLVHQSVIGINCFYSPAQLKAWSSNPRSEKFWDLRLRRTRGWLILNTDILADQKHFACCGFINLETAFLTRGYIDCLYISPKFQNLGLGSALYLELEKWARQNQIPQLTVDASYLSRGLFLKQGFVQMSKTYQFKSGQIIQGFFMQKKL